MKPSPSPVDPITFEVIRHKLMAITEEQRITFQSVSGSPVVTEASDYYTGLFMSDGTIVTMGYKVVTQGGPMTLSIKMLQELFPFEDICPGDVFLTNDPYRAAVHQNDIQVLVPLFYKNQLVMWAGFGAHEVDVGGMDFASWCPKAKDVFQEGIRIAGLKIVEAGRVREDVWRFIMDLTRLPHLLDLDLRGMIAAGHVSQQRVTELLDRFGVEVLEATMIRMLDYSEEKLRARLRQTPDGRFRAVDFLEHDGHADRLYRIALTLTKKDDGLELDFTGSSEQAPGFVNCTRAGLRGGVMGGLFPSIAYDIPWNEGLLRPVTLKTRPGTICDAQFPAPVGAATVEAVWVVKNAVQAALAKLKGCTPGMKSEVQAVSCGTMPTVNLGGMDQYGQRYGIHLLDPMMSGFGAYGNGDGYEVGGSYSTPVPNVANVESNELLSPMLYLRRRLEVDTPGAGQWRGGTAASLAFTVHGVAKTEALIMTHGVEVPNSAGLFGGYPGSCVRQWLVRNSDLGTRQRSGSAVIGREEIEGDMEELGPKPGLLELRPGDVFEMTLQGGGGMGDPLDRDPLLVAKDCRNGFHSDHFAESVYGVILRDDGEVAEEATKSLRERMRQERLASAEAPSVFHQGVVDRLEHCIGGRLILASRGGKTFFACSCGQPLAPREGDWRQGAGHFIGTQGSQAARYKLHPQLEMRFFICPACGALLSVDINEKGAESIRDIELL
ncbi:MAG: hydantoinase B/oxoprolinase family protein [Pseudomonadota bacterium]